MPEYSFKCDNCEHLWSIVCTMKEYDNSQPKSCPSCRKRKFLHRNYVNDSTTIAYVKGLHECTTIGEYADKQTKLYGKEKCEKMKRDFITKKQPETGIKELPRGMSRVKSPEQLSSNITKQQAIRKRKKNK